MPIINKTLKIPFEITPSNEIIEEYFEQNSLSVVRWAIVAVEEKTLIVSAAVIE